MKSEPAPPPIAERLKAYGLHLDPPVAAKLEASLADVEAAAAAVRTSRSLGAEPPFALRLQGK